MSHTHNQIGVSNQRRNTAEVEAIALWAQRTNRSMLAALSAHYGITRGAAVMALRRARQRGAQIPYKSKETSALYVLPSAPTIKVERAVLVCDDCGEQFPVIDGVAALERHVTRTPSRPLARQERTPKVAA